MLREARPGRAVRYGRGRSLKTGTGFYLYVGSALGPGGVRARVLRHCRATGAVHWHIDRLRRQLELVRVWFSYGTHRMECRWAAALAGLRSATLPAARFGASDCRCPAHLIRLPHEPRPIRPQVRSPDGAGVGPAVYCADPAELLTFARQKGER
ncbi:MAG: DUF123 domain-containing protein [Myxococcota bacterium]